MKAEAKLMDDRKQKSRQKIINAFLELRVGKELERLTVIELCKLAGVNKSTFYVHYKDVYDLSEQLEKELTDSIVVSLNHPEDVFEDTVSFTRELFRGYREKNKLIKIIFSGSRSSVLPQMVEKSIKELVFSMRPEYRENKIINIILTYRIYGGFFAYINHQDYDADMVEDIISNMNYTL